MYIKNQTQYFNERIKPYHVKIRNNTSVVSAQEAADIDSKEVLKITVTTYEHEEQKINTTIGYDSGSYDGIYNSILFKQTAPNVNVYVDNVAVTSPTFGFFDGMSFNSMTPVDGICNAVELITDPNPRTVWIIGMNTKTFNLSADPEASNYSVQILWFNDVNIIFNKNSNSVDVQVSTGEHPAFVEGFSNGVTFNPTPVNGICNAVQLLSPMYNDKEDISVILVNKFAATKELPGGQALVSLTGDVKLAYDWPNAGLSCPPGPNDFYFTKIVIQDGDDGTSGAIDGTTSITLP